MTPAASADGKIFKLSLLVLIIILVICRRPELFIEPRFWAEEGAVFFEYAWQHGFFDTVFSQHMGYYALVPSVATAFAALVQLENAPLVTTSFAALCQILVSALIIIGNSPFWDSRSKKLLLAFGLQLINPYEIWLTTISSQFWMTVAVFLILLEPKERLNGATRAFYRLMILIGGLSGGQAIFLTPVYAFKAWRSRCREEKLLTVILASTAMVQALSLAASMINAADAVKDRFDGINFDFANILTLHLVKPFISQAILDLPAIVALDNRFAGFFIGFLPDKLAFVSTLSVLLLVSSAALASLAANRQSHDHQYIACSFLLVTTCSTLMSLQMSSAPRYAFAPAIMLMVLHFRWGRPTGWHRPGQLLSALFLAVSFISLLRDIREPARIYFMPGLPVWRNEVSLWRQDPSYKPMIWPPFMNRRWNIDLQGERSPSAE